jgi:hypothetical protein
MEHVSVGKLLLVSAAALQCAGGITLRWKEMPSAVVGNLDLCSAEYIAGTPRCVRVAM